LSRHASVISALRSASPSGWRSNLIDPKSRHTAAEKRRTDQHRRVVLKSGFPLRWSLPQRIETGMVNVECLWYEKPRSEGEETALTTFSCSLWSAAEGWGASRLQYCILSMECKYISLIWLSRVWLFVGNDTWERA
jgi:hypothetical protein